MIKNVAYFPLQCARNSGPVLNAVVHSLQARGIQTQENSMHSDAAIIWSALWAGRMKANQQVYQHYRQQNKPVIIVEIGALLRGHTWKIALNNITAQGYYGHQNNLDCDRPKKLGISLVTHSVPSPNIVLALQHARSLQVADIDNMTDWIKDTLTQLQKHTDRPIVVRPHPRCKTPLPRLQQGVIIQHPKLLPGTYDSFDLQYNCHAVVNYNSGPGIQAAIAGARPIVDSSSLTAPVSVTLNNIEQPYDIDRDRWLIEICHTEYTVHEIERGTWLNRLESALMT